jgi:hypothetical protein
MHMALWLALGSACVLLAAVAIALYMCVVRKKWRYAAKRVPLGDLEEFQRLHDELPDGPDETRDVALEELSSVSGNGSAGSLVAAAVGAHRPYTDKSTPEAAAYDAKTMQAIPLEDARGRAATRKTTSRPSSARQSPARAASGKTSASQ